jgi:general secretion pathway protein L
VDRETLAALADNILGIAVRPADLLGLSDLNMTLSEPGDYTPAKYNGALGLAAAEINGLHLINFLGERSALKRYWEEYKNNILTSGFIAVMVFFLVMFHVLLDAYYLQRSVDRINSQIVATFQTAFPEISRIVDPVQQMRLALQEVREKSTFAVNLEADISNMELLNEMSRSIPAGLDVEITRWVRGDVDIIITGNTDTFQTVDEIKGSLENSSLWQVITIASANMNNTTNRIEFRLKIDL